MPSSSSSSTPAPHPPPTTNPIPQQQTPPPTTSNLAILIFITSPLIALLPPRKLDIYTFFLGSAFVLSAGHIYSSDSPTSARVRRFSLPVPINTNKARQFNKQSLPLQNNGNDNNNSSSMAAAAQEVEKKDRKEGGGQGQREGDRDRGEGGIKAMVRKLWMGNETVGWEERRVAREREVLDEGGGVGYGELIGESIMDVFGVKREEEEGEGD